MKSELKKIIETTNDSEKAVDAILDYMIDNVSPKMIAEGWAKLKRNHLPRLGSGPGFKEAFIAAIKEAKK